MVSLSILCLRGRSFLSLAIGHLMMEEGIDVIDEAHAPNGSHPPVGGIEILCGLEKNRSTWGIEKEKK